MHRHVERHAAGRPEAPAVHVFSAGRWVGTDWLRLRDMAAGVSEHARRAYRTGAPVLLALDNSAESIAVFLGLTSASVDVLCLEADPSRGEMQQALARRIGAGASIGPAGGDSVLAYTDVMDTAKGPLEAPDRNPEILGMTSGSTGEPRIVRQNLANVERGGCIYRDTYGYTARDSLLGPIPIAHSFAMMGLLAGALVSGARMFTMPRFSVSAVHTAIDEGATVLLGTPMIYRILGMASRPMGHTSSLRALLSSGGPLPTDTRARAEHVFALPVREIYGSTEAGVIACQYDREEPWPAGGAGRIHPSTRWRLRPAGIAGVPAEAGWLHVRTATLFAGYLGGDDGLDANGLYDTGDLVSVDPRGDLTVLARKSSFINVGGRKVEPARVSGVLEACTAVAEAHVFGHEEDGEESVHAAVVLRAPHASVADVLAFCRERLAAYEVPHHVHVLSALPRTTLGKADLIAIKQACALSSAAGAGDGSGR
ncbi:class I adenylate-forming enzyme family protein [Streptomyces marianii]|uniref:Acyl--CoA ligase n=1 Tax=Streptomyces marianii TaxID=1817406 RepID=A0A5R9ECD7_9ACTN|nr:class I adenylate-forming enzyme family protein [Streptomyces marianii]TLQ47861.1 acyl--CoA ligase [Streptomyces marianii]